MSKIIKLSEAVKAGFEELILEGDTREIGKFLAFTTERIIAPQWLKEECGIETIPAPDENKQQANYDRLDVNSGLKIQIKYRGGKTLHLEQTRRTTGKNSSGGAKNGQVRYSIDSFDIMLFVIPNGEYEDISKWEYLAIPAYELEDENIPGYCVGQVPRGVQKKYAGKAKEVFRVFSQLNKI